MRISYWSSDVCSSDLDLPGCRPTRPLPRQSSRGGQIYKCRARRRRLHATAPSMFRSFGNSANGTVHQSRVFPCPDRKSVVEGKSVSVRVDLGGRRIIKKKHKITDTQGKLS